MACCSDLTPFTMRKKEHERGSSSKDAIAASLAEENEELDIVRELCDLYQEALDSGMPEKTVQGCYLAEARRQCTARAARRWANWRFWIFVIFSVASAVIYGLDAASLGIMLSSLKCIVPNNPLIQEAARPLANCAVMCSGLQNGVPTVRNISADDFLKKHARTGRPLLVTDVAKKWKAVEVSSEKVHKCAREEMLDRSSP